MSTTKIPANFRSQQALTGEADIDVSAAVYTSFVALLTIEPVSAEAVQGASVMFDLAKAATGFAAGYGAETIQFAVARKVDGTNWRRDNESLTTAISGTNAAGVCVSIPIGPIGANEQARIEVKLSAETANDAELPYVFYYQSNTTPTLTATAIP